MLLLLCALWPNNNSHRDAVRYPSMCSMSSGFEPCADEHEWMPRVWTLRSDQYAYDCSTAETDHSPWRRPRLW
jgi:hypothetical protein